MNGSFTRTTAATSCGGEGIAATMSAAPGWLELTRELDAWAGSGRVATFWWRDDDAVAPSPELERLLAVRRESGVPLSLAVIPAEAGAPLAGALAGAAGVTVLQHGYSHRNHAPPTEKKTELAAGRPRESVLEELAEGRRRLTALFGGRFSSTLVPPWNRIDPALVPRLPGLGFTALSTFGRRAAAEPAPGLGQTNCHVDLVDWRGSRGFAGAGPTLARTVAHLAARRLGGADGAEPTGLLTHHRVLDEACWAFLYDFLAHICHHRAVRWIGGGEP